MTTKASFAKTLNNNSPPSDDELNQQINDKLSQLWTGMRNKRKQFLRNLTPSYSRRSQLTTSQMNTTHQAANSSATDNQLTKMREKLVSEGSNRKLKQTEVQKLKQTIAQLSNDKKLLVKELHSVTRQHHSYEDHDLHHHADHDLPHNEINDLHLHADNDVNVDGKTANFCNTNNNKHKSSHIFQRKKSPQRTHHSINKSIKENQHQNERTSQSHIQKETLLSLHNLSKTRLIQLLKSTSEYREFAYYYDSHELSYLKRLQEQHKKNCTNNYSSIEKHYWAPTEIVERMKVSNAKQHWGLTEMQLQEVISQMKTYFEANQNEKIKDLRTHYHRKIEKLKREKENKVPYDLVRLANAKDREMGKRRTMSIRQ